MEVVICRLQVAGQNLQKELNVLSGLQIFPSSSNRTFITMVFGDIIFSTGSHKTGNIRSQFYKSILQSKVFQGKEEGSKIVRLAAPSLLSFSSLLAKLAQYVTEKTSSSSLSSSAIRMIEMEITQPGDPVYIYVQLD